MKPLPPLVLTANCSQLEAPVNTLGPKSIVVVNSPLLTSVARFVTGPATAPPPLLVSNKAKVRSKLPLTGVLLSFNRP